MKQKKISRILVLLAMSILLFSGCQNSGTEEPDGPGGVQVDAGTTAIETAIETVPTELRYDILRETVTYANGTVILRYPVFSSKSFEGRGEQINDVVREQADVQFRGAGLGMLDIAVFEYEIEQVTVTYVSDRLISYYATGYSMIDGASHRDDVAYTVNIDVKNASAVTTRDVLTNLAPLVDALDTATLLDGDEAYLQTVSAAELCAIYRDDYALYPPLAYTDDSVLVMIELLYSQGGYAIFEVPATSAASFLKEGALPLEEFARQGE